MKKLRTGIKWLLETENEHLFEILNIIGKLEAQGKQNSETGTSIFKLSHHRYVFFFCIYVLLTEFLLHHLVVKWINTLNEARVVNVGIQEQHASLQKILKKVEAEKMVGGLCLCLNVILLLLWHSMSFIKMQDALRDLEDEKEASVESSRNLLLEDLRRIKLERKCLNEQV